MMKALDNIREQLEVEVELSINDRVSVYAGDNYDMIQDTGSKVQHIMDDHWEHWIDEIAAQTFEEETMQELTKIKAEYSADGVQGDAELSREQILDYGESLKRELESEYPGVEVEVELSINDRVSVYAGDNYDMIQDTGSKVQHIMDDHWEHWIDEIAAQTFEEGQVGREMQREQMLMVPEAKSIDDVIQRMNEVTGDHGHYTGIFNDNGAAPDGDIYLLPHDDIDPHVAKQMVSEGLLHDVEGDIVEYDGSADRRDDLDEKYPAGWCGFSSRDEAYGWTPQA